MRWLSRNQAVFGVIFVVVFAWCAVWVIYDYRSPVSQFLRGIGTVQIDGWSAYDLDTLCIRLEPGTVVPPAGPAAAITVANKTVPGAYIREVLLVTLHDTCNSDSATRLAWAVSLSWTDQPGAPANAPRPRAIVLVDAGTGKLISNHAQNQP